VTSLRVRGTSFRTFGYGTVGGCAIGTVGGTDTGTWMKEKTGLGIIAAVRTGYDLGKVESAILERGMRSGDIEVEMGQVGVPVVTW